MLCAHRSLNTLQTVNNCSSHLPFKEKKKSNSAKIKSNKRVEKELAEKSRFQNESYIWISLTQTRNLNVHGPQLKNLVAEFQSHSQIFNSFALAGSVLKWKSERLLFGKHQNILIFFKKKKENSLSSPEAEFSGKWDINLAVH